MLKNIKILLGIILILIVVGCDDYSELDSPTAPAPPSTGTANFTRFLSIGNSLTAGYQSSALYQSGQVFSYPNLIAKQVQLSSFAQPLISDPGIGGLIKISSLNPFVTTQEPVQGGTPINLNHPYPYNNLGIPGIVLGDVINATSTTNSFSKSPFIDLVLRGIGSQFKQAKLLQPTFLTLWIGNNDVLGFATSGGVEPAEPTSSQDFNFLFNQLADSISTLGAKVVVANIPSIIAIPFFTTVGPGVAQKLTSLQIPGFYYQKHGEYSGSAGAPSQLSSYAMLLTLVSQTYMADLGKATGKFWKDNNVDISQLIAAGILDTTKFFGLDPKNPIPDALILDDTEIITANQSVTSFNSSIASVANAKGWGLVDFNTFFSNIRANDTGQGTLINGINFKTTFVSGGLFSLDGVHPTSQGQAIIANEFIKIINSKFGAAIPLIDVASIPGSLLLAKTNFFNTIYPDYKFNLLKDLYF